ncbi:MAG: alpha/beta hydrolase [Candidatus Izemoplasmatales bacterium]
MMVHKFIKKSNSRLMILFHGTGGDENSLIPLAETIDQESSILGIRGNVNENGLNRFFKRIRPGVFNQESLIKETENLKVFLDDFLSKNNFSYDNINLIGYSNGANILASLLLIYGKMAKTTILLHPMVPFRNKEYANLEKQKILLTSGKNDPIVSFKESEELNSIFLNKRADIDFYVYFEGHSISNKEIEDIIKWYRNNCF